eukprot:3760111-Pleurochrysis_carterae.AAC.1
MVNTPLSLTNLSADMPIDIAAEVCLELLEFGGDTSKAPLRVANALEGREGRSSIATSLDALHALRDLAADA